MPAECLDDRPSAEKGPVRVLARPASKPAVEDDPGGVLRRAREAHGLSLADLSRVTKISVAQLAALEANAFELLPSGVYVRGFLRAYAREVDLDPEDTVHRYFVHREAHQDMVSVIAPPPAVTTGWRSVGGGRGTGGAATGIAHDTGPARVAASGLSQWLVIGVAVAGLAAYLMMKPTNSSVGEEPDAEASLPAADATPAARADAPAEVAQASAGDLAVPDLLQIEFAPRGPCWIAANADGTPALTKLLQAGDRRSLDVRDTLVLRVGEPGALVYTINGRPGRSLGRPGEPVTVRITRENFREFLAGS